MTSLRQKLAKLAGIYVPVLIRGESGTGKEIIARLIHIRSPWSTGPFVKVNCPAIPGTLLESELFGYEKGAFTGAYGSKPGRVELAKGGTLFLDELAELEPGLQAKLLQLLQDGQFSRIGSREETAVNVRVVCATNRDLEKEIELGTFREDLFYRINVVTLHLPALRERAEDIPVLVNYFLAFYNRKFKCNAGPLSLSALKRLQNNSWPGNIRQLENLIKRYVILGSEEVVSEHLLNGSATTPSEFAPPVISADGSISLKELTRQAVQNFEGKIILKVLEANNWNRKKTAKVLKISYRALLYKVRDGNLHFKFGKNGTKRISDASESKNSLSA